MPGSIAHEGGFFAQGEPVSNVRSVRDPRGRGSESFRRVHPVDQGVSVVRPHHQAPGHRTRRGRPCPDRAGRRRRLRLRARCVRRCVLHRGHLDRWRRSGHDRPAAPRGRHCRASPLVTSNHEPAEWLTMTSDALLAQFAVDRLASGAHTLIIEGPFFRERTRPGHHAGIDSPGRGPQCSLTLQGGPMLVATSWSHQAGK